jgi:thiamine phosphate synthase YjbQ (UPF0047 family)
VTYDPINGEYMTVSTHTLSLKTRGDADIHDITDMVADAIRSSKVQDGTVTVFCPSSTSGVTTIEYESGALSDLRRLFDESSRQQDYPQCALREMVTDTPTPRSICCPSLSIPSKENSRWAPGSKSFT